MDQGKPQQRGLPVLAKRSVGDHDGFLVYAGRRRGRPEEVERSVGQVLSFIVESAGGCAEFWCFENGTLRRSIQDEGAVTDTHGDPLAEEAGIDTSHYYMTETEALWKAFGLSPYEAMASSVKCQATCVIDRTDYGDLFSTRPKGAKKPWWKFW